MLCNARSLFPLDTADRCFLHTRIVQGCVHCILMQRAVHILALLDIAGLENARVVGNRKKKTLQIQLLGQEPRNRAIRLLFFFQENDSGREVPAGNQCRLQDNRCRLQDNRCRLQDNRWYHDMTRIGG